MRKNLPEIKDGAYVIYLDEYETKARHWIAFYVNGDNVTYFDNFGVEHIPKEMKSFIGNKNITTNIFRIQAYDSVMCWYFCFGCIDVLLKGKSLLEYNNLFLPYDHEKSGKIILKTLKYHIFY